MKKEKNMTGSSQPMAIRPKSMANSVSSPHLRLSWILLSPQLWEAHGWQLVWWDSVSKTASWKGARRHWWQGPQWAGQRLGWHDAGLVTGDSIARSHWLATKIKIHLPSNRSRASHFNLPKWQTAIIAQNDIHSRMTTFNTL